MSSARSDIVIVGGGIVGAACARACARAGLSVLLIERNVIGGGATAAGMGHLVALDDSDAQFALCRRSQQLWHELIDEMPAGGEFEPRGTLWVAADDEELEEARRKERFYRAHHIDAELVDRATLARLEPNLRADLCGGLLVRGDAIVYPPVIAQWLVDSAIHAGARVLTGKRVTHLFRGGVELDDHTQVLAQYVVNATGHAAAELCPELPMRPRKGHLAITARYPGFVSHQLIELGYLKSAHGSATDSVAFNVQPRATGQLLLGSSRQLDIADADIDLSVLARMLKRAMQYMPRLADLQIIRTWTGIRAATSDNLPIIGAHPSIPGLYLATGHEGLGITQSLGTAELLLDMLLGRQSCIDPAPFAPDRFTRKRAPEFARKETHEVAYAG